MSGARAKAGALPGAARACASSAAHRCRWLLSESVKPLKPSVLSTASRSASVTASRPSCATRCRASLTSRLRNSPVQTWTASTASSDRAARGSVLMVCAMTWRTPRMGRDIDGSAFCQSVVFFCPTHDGETLCRLSWLILTSLIRGSRLSAGGE